MRKKFALLFFSVAFSIILLEGGARISYYLMHGQGFPREEFQQRLLPDSTVINPKLKKISMKIPSTIADKALHPYLGFVMDPTESPDRLNRFGFLGPDPVIRKSQDRVVVAVLGGSVAEFFYRIGADSFELALQRSPEFRDKEIVLVSVALRGYKQPQQLLALAYLLSLGASFDIVVNLDGFNEVALPYADNLPSGVYTPFPRLWNLYARKGLDVESNFLMARMQVIKNKRDKWRRLIGANPLRHSAFLLQVLDVLDNRFARQLADENARLGERVAMSKVTYQSSGPFEPYEDLTDFFRDAVEVWKQSSLQMAHLCKGNGIRYFHFLQPNQYVAGSKVLSEEESRTAYKKHHYAYKEAVDRAYGLLISEGAKLKAAGLPFTDLTRLFQGEARTVYIDSCCHFNQLGNDLIAQEMARVITAR